LLRHEGKSCLFSGYFGDFQLALNPFDLILVWAYFEIFLCPPADKSAIFGAECALEFIYFFFHRSALIQRSYFVGWADQALITIKVVSSLGGYVSSMIAATGSD
jgi:hypothetical protein